MGPFRGQGGRGSSRGSMRGGRHDAGGPKLPSSLMAEVDSAYGSSNGGRKDRESKKEQRKYVRDQRGYRSIDDRGVHPSLPVRQSLEAASGEGSTVNRPSPETLKMSAKALGKRPAPPEPPQSVKKKKKIELQLPSEKTEDAEDQEIEWLEYMLRKEKEKGKGKDDELGDGLDNLLDFTDIIGPGGRGLTYGEASHETQSEDEMLSDDGSMILESSDEGSDVDEGDVEEDEGEEVDGDQDDATDSSSSAQAPDEEVWDGIKSPSLDPSGAEPSEGPKRYIPPYLREAQLAEKAAGDKEKLEEKRKLDRRVKGLLNKLSEANIEKILADIDNLYRDHSRNDVTTSLTSLVIEMISSRSNLLDSFVVLYATLVGALHRVVGLVFGAHFVHTLATRYHTLTTDPNAQTTSLAATIYETPNASKESLNLLTLISELFNAGVIGSGLIYDLVRGFLASGNDVEVMGEKEVEGLLKILKCSGPQLRSDDPASLKDIVALVQDKTRGKEKSMTSRARFMIETLTNVKNGKNKAGGVEQGEAAVRMKKFLSSLDRKRRLLATEPLRVTLNDLINAEKKGKWWLVGAGWSGNPLVELEGTQAMVSKSKTKQKQTVGEDQALLNLARKQGMNTEVRRSIFVVLMTSEDYVHACDRLNALRLTSVQQREFVRVALHCCGMEKQYNPYYTLCLNHLCANSYDHRFTLQYALWDFLKVLAESDSSKEMRRRIGNIARAMAYVVARGSIDLTVFKAVEWTELTAQTTSFLTTFLIYLCISTQTVSPVFVSPKSSIGEFDVESIQEVFETCLSNLELAQGWGMYMKTEMTLRKREKAIEGCGLGDKERILINQGLAIALDVVLRAV